MKNKEFFYRQYDKVNWKNQKKTKINELVNDFIITNIFVKHKGKEVSIFDIGFGIGFFFLMIQSKLIKLFDSIILEGCEPSIKNFDSLDPGNFKKVFLQIFNKPFLELKTKRTFDFITAIYVFPHFLTSDLDDVVKKIKSMLKIHGKFVLVVANDKYLEKKLKTKKDLFIEKSIFEFNGKQYIEVLHYSEIPKIGTIIDYNREENFYIDLFSKHGLDLFLKKSLDDNGFICTVFVFSKSRI